MRRLSALLLAALLVGAVQLVDATATTTTPGTWTVGEAMGTTRYGHTSTVLEGGKILMAGGHDGADTALASAELYDPATRSFTALPDMEVARVGHTANLLPGGRVLVVGGGCCGRQIVTATTSAELFDPVTGSWSPARPMLVARLNHTATLLPDGRVLVAGGSGRSDGNANVGLVHAEVYDPSDNAWSETGEMTERRDRHAAVLIPDDPALPCGPNCGKVLVTGGSVINFGSKSAEVYDPDATTVLGPTLDRPERRAHVVRGGWRRVAPMSVERDSHTLTALPDGRVLAIGGRAQNEAVGGTLASTEAFDPRAGGWVPGASMSVARYLHAAVTVGGKVLVSGGATDERANQANPDAGSPSTAVAELYDPGPGPGPGTWSQTGRSVVPRLHHTLSQLGGKVLAAGGGPAPVEIFDPVSLERPPTIMEIAPSRGPTSGGTEVRITGAGFDEVKGARFDGTPAAIVASGPAEIVVRSPARASPGTVAVSVTTQRGSAPPQDSEILGHTRFTYVGPTQTWRTTGSLHANRTAPTATVLWGPRCGDVPAPEHCGRVLVTGGSMDPRGEIYDGASQTWSTTEPMQFARFHATATLLPDGKVLVAGGCTSAGDSCEPLATAETYDPELGTWQPTAPMTLARRGHTETLLMDGRVLVAGGRDDANGPLRGAELYDPGLRSWIAAAPMSSPRFGHTATLLWGPHCRGRHPQSSCGHVLVAGGGDTTSTETYDPGASADGAAPGSWTILGRGSLKQIRWGHTAVLLSGPACGSRVSPRWCGSVLVAGGKDDAGAVLGTAEIYSPHTTSWAATAPLTDPRFRAAATLLPGGRVLVSGGEDGDSRLSTSEVYDPSLADWALAERFTSPRASHQTVLLATGRILAAGGALQPTVEALDGVALPNPTVTDISQPVGSTLGGTRVWLTGTGLSLPLTVRVGSALLRPLFRSDTALVVVTPPGAQGAVDVGVVTPGGESAPRTFRYGPGSWAPTDEMNSRGPTCLGIPGQRQDCAARFLHTATALGGPKCQDPGPSYCGDVLVTGGTTSHRVRWEGEPPMANSEIYDIGQMRWEAVAPLLAPRFRHTATSVDGALCRGPDAPEGCGNVVVAGGSNADGAVASVERFDPVLRTWSPHGTLLVPRFSHTATILDGPLCKGTAPAAWCGKILFVGGSLTEGTRRTPLASAELFDPVTGQVAFTGSLSVDRVDHTATLLPDGRVLVVGGTRTAGDNDRVPLDRLDALASAEIYDPATGSWDRTGDLSVARFAHSATLLDRAPCGSTCGKVLVIGGFNAGGALQSSEVFDPTTGKWEATAAVPRSPHGRHTATMLPDGRVLVAGSDRAFDGAPADLTSDAAEVFDPVVGTWEDTDYMRSPRGNHSATVIEGPWCRGHSTPAACGRVLITGGSASRGLLDIAPALSSSELYTPAPSVANLTPRVARHDTPAIVNIAGTGFSQGSLVTFGGDPADAVEVGSLSEITARSPRSSAGPVEVAVTNDRGTSARLDPHPYSLFRYLGQPSAPAGLIAKGLSSSTVELSFLAPPASEGPSPPAAAEFVVKQSYGPMANDDEFGAAMGLCGGKCEFSGVQIGDRLTLSVRDLSPATTYYFAVQAVNQVGVHGPVSERVSVTTPSNAPEGSSRCPAPAEEGAGRVLYKGGRYSLVGVPTGTVLGSGSPLYGWFDQGAGDAYSVADGRGAVAEGARGYWAWFPCPHLVTLAGVGTPSASLSLGGYRASMVGNPSGLGPAVLTGHDFAARWDADVSDGAGGYHISGFREPQELAVGEGIWAFSYSDTTLTISGS